MKITEGNDQSSGYTIPEIFWTRVLKASETSGPSDELVSMELFGSKRERFVLTMTRAEAIQLLVGLEDVIKL